MAGSVAESLVCADTVASALLAGWPRFHTDMVLSMVLNSHFTDEGQRQGLSNLSKISVSLSLTGAHTHIMDAGFRCNFVVLNLKTIAMYSRQTSPRSSVTISLAERHRGQRSGHLGSSPNSATRVTGAVRQALYTLGLSFFIHSMRIRI